MKQIDTILAELKVIRAKLDQAVAIHKMTGTEGHRLLLEAVAEELRQYGRRLMQMDCLHDETNQLRAKISSLNWFIRWSAKEAAAIPELVKRMEGLQKLAVHRHDAGSEAKKAEIDQLVAGVADLKTEVLSHE